MPYKDVATRRAYARDWRNRRRALFMDGQVCSQCGATEDLEFHHVDPAQKITHRLWGWRLDRIVEELAKCVVLCGPCHDELHSAERRLPCGTDAAYGRGCRCQECRVAHSDANRRSRLLRGAIG